ncbi:MAG: glycoside hydrolase family 3 N-terminal domain-containing protein [Planctomycetota bacterium]
MRSASATQIFAQRCAPLLAWALYCAGSLSFAQPTGPGYVEAAPAAAAPAAQVTPAADVPSGEPAIGQRGQQPAIRFDVVAGDLDHRIDRLLEQMTLAEKIGQLVQVYPNNEALSEEVADRVRAGGIGSVFYPGNRAVVEEAQRIAVEESRLGIPLLVARDVVHGMRTIFPIPLGQAATWDAELVERAAVASAEEARAERIDWTFAPMVDVCRDARWGRIAETFGEDPLLAGELAAAMVRGFQQEEDGRVGGVLACAKHFVGYGFSEGGRDYNRVSVSHADLHNVMLPPFRQAVDAGCRTLMTTFSEVNGVPGTAHRELLRGVLKRDWRFQGFVVSDWGSVTEMVAHGFAADEAQAGRLALMAGVDMDMCSPAFAKHLEQAVREGRVPMERIDDAVRRVLRSKVDVAGRPPRPALTAPRHSSLDLARRVAARSAVLLKNDGALPLDAASLKRVAVIGPMADAPQQQLGCWSLDGKPEDSVTPLADLRNRLDGLAEVLYSRGCENTFSGDGSLIAEAERVAAKADVALLFVGEGATLSGEARCRATLDLPGVQPELVDRVVATGVPTVLVVMAGRPLAMGEQIERAHATLYAWHPGTMAGPALGDLLFGEECPSGKLPVTFPRSVGHTPIYYNHPNTGRPRPDDYRPLFGSGRADLPEQFQYKSHYLDEAPTPLFPFGFGLSYTTFEYSAVEPSNAEFTVGDTLTVTATVTNTGGVPGAEVVQLYARDHVAGAVRPVRELKGRRRVTLEPGESRRVEFKLDCRILGYFDSTGARVCEPGEFSIGIGGDSTVDLAATVRLLAKKTQLAPNLPAVNPTAVSPALVSPAAPTRH